MTLTERSAKTPPAKTGRFSRLGAFLRVPGSGAPSARRTPFALASIFAAAAFLALTATPASAAFTYSSLGEISGPGPGESFSELKPESVAVNDKNGHILIADSGTGLVYDFESAADTSPEIWNGSETPAGSFGATVAVAVDNSSGDVYVSDSAHAVIDKFNQEGELIESFGDTEESGSPAPNGQLAGLKTPAGSFIPAERGTFGIAVDQASGDLYAIDAGHEAIDVFSEEGAYLEQIAANLEGLYNNGCEFTRTDGIAVNDAIGHVFVFGACSGRLFEFDSSGAYIKTLDGSNTPAGSFGAGFFSIAADDASGRVYVTETTDRVTDAFDSSGTYLTQFSHSFNEPRGTAVDQATGRVYVSDNAPGVVDVFDALVIPDVNPEAPSEVKPASATLKGKVNPDGLAVTECRFEYVEDAHYQPAAPNPYAAGQSAPCETESGEPIGSGTEAVEVHADVSGLDPDTTYHYRLVAANANGTNTGQPPHDEAFTTTGPGIHSESVSNVASTSATLEATIDPDNAPTTYYFQYGTGSLAGCTPSTCPSIPAPPGPSIGSAKGDVEVSQHLQEGLSAGTTYHYRVVARSELSPGEFEEFTGPELTFTTQVPAPFALPDGRQWQLVSPPDKHGALLMRQFQAEWDFQAAAGGDAITYLTTAPTEAHPQGFTNFTQVLSARGPGGWASLDLNPPHTEETGQSVGQGLEYQYFSSDLSHAALQPFGGFEPSLSPAASEQTAYLRTDFPSAEPTSFCVTSCYRPLVTGCPEVGEPCPPAVQAAADVPAGTAFGGLTAGECGGKILCGPRFLAATPDLSHVVLRSPVPLTAAPVEGGLYEWSAAKLPSEQLKLISLLPADEEGGEAVTGVMGEIGLAIGPAGSPQRMAGMISEDGSSVVWYTTSPEHLYLRETAKGETVRLDAVQPGASGEGPANPLFQAASADGSEIFFTDEQQLTEGAGASHHEPDLYRCEIVENSEGKLECELSDLTPSNAGEAANVRGAVIGASEDGSRIYFVARGVLSGAEQNEDGDEAQSGQFNLYLRHAGATQFIAGLSAADAPDWGKRSFEDGGNGRLWVQPARVSPNGHWLAFQSQRPLTGYDNRDARSGEPDEEVYLYDATANGDEGKLVCASCNPTGARPVGVEAHTADQSLARGEDGVWSNGVWVAANVPGWTLPNYQSRYLSDSGRLFFNSSDALVPQDVNGTEDVYQYEPAGVGDCSASSATFSERSGGCASLISSGVSAEESAFMDASESGDDVFFLTSARLAPQDVDTSLDLYDAHACSASVPCLPAPPPPSPACEGDACQQPAVPPNHPTPGTSLLNGPGNEHPARKHHRKKRKHHRKHHKAKHQRGGASKQSQSDSSAPRAKPKHVQRAANTDRRATR